MEIRIGVTQALREIVVEVDGGDKERAKIKASVEAALSGATDTLWLIDKKGREVGVASAKVAYVEIGNADSDRKIGFGD